MKLNVTAVVIGVAIFGCKKPQTVEEEPKASASASTRWVSVKAPDDASLLEAPAVARAGGESSGDVSATVRARVVRVHVRPGDVVKKGAPIVDVAAPEWVEAAATYLYAAAQLKVHAERAEALGALKGEGLVSGQQLFEQQSNVARLRSEMEKAMATLRVAGISPSSAGILLKTGEVTLGAPLGGVVTEVNARLGEFREAGVKPFAKITGTASAHIEARTADQWPSGASVQFSASDGRILELKPTPLSSVLSVDDGTYIHWYELMDAQLPLPDGLWGVIRLKSPQGVWQVPVGAVEAKTGSRVLVRRRGGETKEVAVQVVVASGASAWVRPLENEALKPGDEVAENIARYREANAP